MIEDRKVFYISKRQRTAVTLVVGGAILLFGLLLVCTVATPSLQHAVSPVAELLKLSLTGAAVWLLIVMYASANSAERISKETDAFFDEDLRRAFNNAGFVDAASGDGTTVELLRNSAGTCMVRTVRGLRTVILWCNLNVNRISVVYLLDAEFESAWESTFIASVKGLKAQGLSVEEFGTNTHDADGALPHASRHFELYSVRALPDDFLFNAAARYALAANLVGDARSFLIETERAHKEAATHNGLQG